MANFFVRKTGNDANAGTSAGAAWLTIGKALGAAGISSGDTVYVGAGTYREAVTVAMTSATVETKVIADVDGAQTGDAGRVILTCYLTNDTTLPSSNPLISLTGRNFLTFQGFYMLCGSNATGAGLYDGGTGSTNIKLTRCVVVQAGISTAVLRFSVVAGVAANWTVDQCIFFTAGAGICFNVSPATSGGGVDYDIGLTITNSLFILATGAIGVFLNPTGALANKPGGGLVQNCSFYGGAAPVSINTATLWSTSIPAKVYNSTFYGATTGLTGGAVGQLVEDFNLIQCNTARSNVTAGGSSIATFADAPLYDAGYSTLNGFLPRGDFELLPGAPLLGFGNTGAVAALTTDILGRPRPAGGNSVSLSVGAFERHDTAAKETGTTDAGGVGLSITGPGDHDLQIPVNATATTITIRARYDATHAATNKPQVQLQANGEIGVALQTVTMTAAVDTFETLTVGPFTPTGKGWVTLRLLSRAAATAGKAFFDTLTVS